MWHYFSPSEREYESSEKGSKEVIDSENKRIIIRKPYRNNSFELRKREMYKYFMEAKKNRKSNEKVCYNNPKFPQWYPTDTRDKDHHKEHHREIPHHVIYHKPEWTILWYWKKGRRMHPREKCKAYKKTLPICDSLTQRPEKRHKECKIKEWCNPKKTILYSFPKRRNLAVLKNHLPIWEWPEKSWKDKKNTDNYGKKWNKLVEFPVPKCEILYGSDLIQVIGDDRYHSQTTESRDSCKFHTSSIKRIDG